MNTLKPGKILSCPPLETVVLTDIPVDLAILIKVRSYSHHLGRRDITDNGKM